MTLDHPDLCQCTDAITPHYADPNGLRCDCDGACRPECPCHKEPTDER